MVLSFVDRAIISGTNLLNQYAPILFAPTPAPDGGDGGGGGNVDSFFTDWGSGGEGDGVFGGLLTGLKGLGSSAYSLFFYVALMVGAIFILINCIKIIAGGAQGKAEGKGALVWIIAGIALAACALSIVKVVAAGAQGLFG